MLIIVIISAFVCCLIYLVIKPPAPKLCGSPNGPPITSPRIRLRDGRYLAYKTAGSAKENAKYKVIMTHGFCTSKETYVPVSDNWLEELGVCLVTFDRPGYAESDPNLNRSPRSDAFDIQELADQLQLGPKIYLIGCSIGSYPFWGCLKYLPHRLAGAALVAPLINIWWPSLPSAFRAKVLKKLSLLEQLRLWLFHHCPLLAWCLLLLFPLVNIDVLLKKNPEALNKSDLAIMKILKEHSHEKRDKVNQQGTYESLHRDWAVFCSTWEFDPLNDLKNPFPDNKGTVHLWMGKEDKLVDIDLLYYVAKKLQWIKPHEVPHGGHLLIHDKNVVEKVIKSLVLGEEQPCFG